MSSLFISASLLWKGHIVEKRDWDQKFSLSRLFYTCTHMTMGQESRNNLYIGNDTNQHFHWLSKDFSLHQRNRLTHFKEENSTENFPLRKWGMRMNKIFFNPYYQNLYISVSVKILRMHVYYDAYIYLMTMVSLSFCSKIRSVICLWLYYKCTMYIILPDWSCKSSSLSPLSMTFDTLFCITPTTSSTWFCSLVKNQYNIMLK